MDPPPASLDFALRSARPRLQAALPVNPAGLAARPLGRALGAAVSLTSAALGAWMPGVQGATP